MADRADATTLSHAWVRAVAEHRDHTFLVFERPDGVVESWSYGEFDAVVSRVAQFLVNHGVVPGSSVHLALTNSPTFVAVWLATLRLRAWIVPSDPMGTRPIISTPPAI